MPRRPSRFSGFNRQSVALWLVAALLATVVVWLAPTAPPARPAPSDASADGLVFFELAEDAGPLPDADTLWDAAVSDASRDVATRDAAR